MIKYAFSQQHFESKRMQTTAVHAVYMSELV